MFLFESFRHKSRVLAIARENRSGDRAGNIFGVHVQRLSALRRLNIFPRVPFSIPRTKDLIEVVIQLNSTKGFLAVSTFHTDRLQVYPIIFIDPAKV